MRNLQYLILPSSFYLIVENNKYIYSKNVYTNNNGMWHTEDRLLEMFEGQNLTKILEYI